MPSSTWAVVALAAALAACHSSVTETQTCCSPTCCATDPATADCSNEACTLTLGSESDLRDIAVSNETLFWMTRSEVKGVPTSGGPVHVLESGTADHVRLAVNDVSFFWSAGSRNAGLLSCPVAGCSDAPVVLASGSSAGPLYDPFQLVVDAQSIYWTTDIKYSIERCALDGCAQAPTVLFQGPPCGGSTGAIAVDDAKVYWDDPSRGSTGSIVSCDKLAGCGPGITTLAPDLANVDTIRIAGTTMYWTDFDTFQLQGYVRSCALPACANPTQLPAFLSGGPLEVDDTSIYWTDYGASVGPGTLWKCARDNCLPTRRTIATGVTGGFAIDATSVYFQKGSEILKVTPK